MIEIGKGWEMSHCVLHLPSINSPNWKISLTHHAFQYLNPTNIPPPPLSLSLSLSMYNFFHPLFAPYCANSVLIFPSHETTNSIFLTPDISFTSLFIYFRNWTVDYITSFKLNITYTFSQVIKVMLTKNVRDLSKHSIITWLFDWFSEIWEMELVL